MGESAVHITRIDTSKLGIEPRTGRALIDKRVMVLGVLEVLSVEQAAFTDVMRGRCAQWGKADYATKKATIGCAFGFPHIACP